MGGSFNDLVKADVQDVFLQEFSQQAIYVDSKTSIKTIQVQMFEQSLDGADTTYWSVFCDYLDVPNIKKGETLQIDGVLFGIIDVSVDEHKVGVNIYLQKR